VIDSDPSPSVYNWSDGFTNPANPFADVKPGSTGEQIIDIKNIGGIDGNATIQLNRTSADNELANNLTFTIYFDGNHDGSFDATGISGTLNAFTGTYTLGPITSLETSDGVTPYLGKIASVKIVWSVPSSAGNEIAGKSVTVDAVFGLEQTP